MGIYVPKRAKVQFITQMLSVGINHLSAMANITLSITINHLLTKKQKTILMELKVFGAMQNIFYIIIVASQNIIFQCI
jgi:hypothetical protein